MALFCLRIILFGPDYRPDPPAGIYNITSIPRDEVQVGMHHRLACSLSAVHSDIVTCRRKDRIKMGFCTPDQFTYGRMFGGSKIEPGRYMPAGNDQNMSRRDRIEIPFHISESVAE